MIRIYTVAVLIAFVSLGNAQGPIGPISGQGSINAATQAALNGKAPNLASQTIYVDTGGNDTTGQRGTMLPVLTVAKALTLAQNGDRIVVRPGNYTPATGSLMVTQNNLTIDGYGAIINATSQTDVRKILVTGDHVTINGITVDGKWTNGARNQNAGLITVWSTNCTLRDVYVHHGASYGIDLQKDFSGANVLNCRAEYNAWGIAGNNIDLGASGVQIQGCTVQNNALKGISIDKDAFSSAQIYGINIIGNIVRNNPDVATALTVGIEIFAIGSGSNIEDNYVSGSNTGISAGGTIACNINNNLVMAGNFCGIEMIGTDVQAVGNMIYGAGENGTLATGVGYSLGQTGSGYYINGGVVIGTHAAVHADVTGPISIRNLYANPNPAVAKNVLYLQHAGGPVTVEGCRLELTNTGDNAIDIQQEAGDTRFGFFLRNNVFNGQGISQVHALISFFQGVYNNVVVSGTRVVGITSCSGTGTPGFLVQSGSGIAVNSPQYTDNLPINTDGTAMTGFFGDNVTHTVNVASGNAGIFKTTSNSTTTALATSSLVARNDDPTANNYVKYGLQALDSNSAWQPAGAFAQKVTARAAGNVTTTAVISSADGGAVTDKVAINAAGLVSAVPVFAPGGDNSGTHFLADDGAYHTLAGGGSVSAFTAGTLSPIFSTSVANGTTTPALSFVLSNAAAHSYLGNNTGGSAAPDYHVIAFSELSGTAATAQMADSAVTYAKIQNVSSKTLLGNPTGGGAAPLEVSLDGGLSFSGTKLRGFGPTQALSAYAIDAATAKSFSKTLTAGPNTFTISNLADGDSILLRCKQVPSGSVGTVVLPAAGADGAHATYWKGGAQPVQTVTVNKSDRYVCSNDSGDLYCFADQNY